MVRPSAPLSARLPLTTKQVNGGYYKGNRTGSMGAHTAYGGYVIDYRKTRNYNCPDLSNNRLTPFVTAQVAPRKSVARLTGPAFIEAWKADNASEYEEKRAVWRSYLEGEGMIAIRQDQIPAVEASVVEAQPVDGSDGSEGPEGAMAKTQEDGARSGSWFARAFRR